MKLKIILTFLSWILLNSLRAQEIPPKYESLYKYIYAQSKLTDLSICDRALHLVRFRIDSAGSVRDISFSRNTDPMIKMDLQRVLLSTTGKWKPAFQHGKVITSRYLIFPVMIDIEKGCNQTVIENYFRPKHKTHLDSAFSKVKSHTLAGYFSERGYKAMIDLFIFDDNTIPVDYIILPTLNFEVML